jgi:hypothetical protein
MSARATATGPVLFVETLINMIIKNKELPIEINGDPRQGFINIYRSDDEFHIELHVGVQSFKLDYSNEEYESARWMAKQFAHALNLMVGDVELYGTKPERLDDPDKGYDEGETNVAVTTEESSVVPSDSPSCRK